MEYLAIALLAFGTLGVAFSRKKHWDHSLFKQYKIYSTLATIAAVAGWVLCIVSFGWKGIIPIFISMVIGRIIVG